MKKSNDKQVLGIAIIDYTEDGRIHSAKFQPGVAIIEPVVLGPDIIARDEKDAVMHAEHVLAAWFIKTGNVEVMDREVTFITHEVKNCVKWPSGIPKYCEVEFYLDTVVGKEPRIMTGVK